MYRKCNIPGSNLLNAKGVLLSPFYRRKNPWNTKLCELSNIANSTQNWDTIQAAWLHCLLSGLELESEEWRSFKSCILSISSLPHPNPNSGSSLWSLNCTAAIRTGLVTIWYLSLYWEVLHMSSGDKRPKFNFLWLAKWPCQSIFSLSLFFDLLKCD